MTSGSRMTHPRKARSTSRVPNLRILGQRLRPPPNAPNPPSDEAAAAAPPDLGKNPASGDEKADPGATVGSKRRPGSPSNPAAGATGLITASATPGFTNTEPDPDPLPGPVDPANPSVPDPADWDLNEKVPPEDSVREPLNQVRWSACGVRISEMDLVDTASAEALSRRTDSCPSERTVRGSFGVSSTAKRLPFRVLEGPSEPASSKSSLRSESFRERRARPRSRLKLGISSSEPRLPSASMSSDFSTSRGFTEPGSTNQFFLRSYSSISRCWAFGSRLGMVAADGLGKGTSMAPPRELPARNTSN